MCSILDNLWSVGMEEVVSPTRRSVITNSDVTSVSVVVMVCAMAGSLVQIDVLSTEEGIQNVYSKLIVREVFI